MANSVSDDDSSNKRSQFGNRHLTDPKNVFEHNAWDNVVWDEDQEKEARQKTEVQQANPATAEDIEKYDREANEYWNKFYTSHENKFFKDRQWLFTEFPELAPEAYLTEQQLAALATSTVNKGPSDVNDTKIEERVGKLQVTAEDANTSVGGNNDTYPGESARYRIFEVGCGVGNTVFPVLQTNNDPGLMVYCSDFSSTAIDLVMSNQDYNPARCHAFVCDISDPVATVPFPQGSLDVVILIFVLSALRPDKFQATLNRLASFLKPGGVILFRDYGRFDMAQLRFKKGRCLSENFYARGDGTRVYFFTQEEMRDFMTKAGLVEKQNLVDRRLQVNRGRQLKMYRVWIQCKYTKPLVARGQDTSTLTSDQHTETQQDLPVS